MKKVPLSVAERLIVQGLLPEKHNYLNLCRIRKLREALSFSDEELEKFGLVADGEGRVTWSVSEDKDIEFGPEMFVLVKNKLVEMDKKNELPNTHESLYVKFAADVTELKLVE